MDNTALPVSPCALLSTLDHPHKLWSQMDTMTGRMLLYLSLLALPLSWSAYCHCP